MDYYIWYAVIALLQIIIIILWISFIKADKEYKVALNDYLEELRKQLHKLN